MVETFSLSTYEYHLIVFLKNLVACFAKHTSLNFNALAEMLLYPSQQTRFTAFTASYRYQPLTLVRTSH